ncbi:MAG: helix-turn-helix transcriptional regulator [Planctomycetia bacterium]|nr:MAG: helix-turn-helix transcriptional regulator [Planctomycetia bacterium]
MANRSATLDRIFHGLADPTRRAVLHRLARGPAPVSDLAKSFAMSLPAFTQHLGVLEASGLVRSRKSGRVRTYSLAPRAFKPAEHWLAQQRRIWESRLDQLDTFLTTLVQPENS